MEPLDLPTGFGPFDPEQAYALFSRLRRWADTPDPVAWLSTRDVADAVMPALVLALEVFEGRLYVDTRGAL